MRDAADSAPRRRCCPRLTWAVRGHHRPGGRHHRRHLLRTHRGRLRRRATDGQIITLGEIEDAAPGVVTAKADPSSPPRSRPPSSTSWNLRPGRRSAQRRRPIHRIQSSEAASEQHCLISVSAHKVVSTYPKPVPARRWISAAIVTVLGPCSSTGWSPRGSYLVHGSVLPA